MCPLVEPKGARPHLLVEMVKKTGTFGQLGVFRHFRPIYYERFVRS